MHIGNEIRRLREELGLTQAELANGLATASYVSQIERGTAIPSRKVLQALAIRLQKPAYHFEALASETDNRELRIKLERLQALTEQGSFDKATVLIKELEREETELWDAYFHGKWNFCRGYLAWRMEKLDDALYFFRQALERYETCGHVTEIARSLRLLSRVHRQRNDLELAAAYARRAIGVLAESGHDPEQLYSLRLQLAVIVSEQGNWEEARTLYEEVSRYEDSIDYGAHISLLLGLSHTYEQTAQTELAFEYATRARMLAEQHSDLLMVAVSERVMADGFLRIGELNKAHNLLDKALDKQLRIGSAYERARLLLRKAKAYALQEDASSAENAIARALSMERQDSPSTTLINAEANAVRALLYKGQGNHNEAAAHYLRAGEMFLQAERRQLACKNFRDAADLLYDLGDFQQAYKIQQRALDLTEERLHYPGP